MNTTRLRKWRLTINRWSKLLRAGPKVYFPHMIPNNFIRFSLSFLRHSSRILHLFDWIHSKLEYVHKFSEIFIKKNEKNQFFYFSNEWGKIQNKEKYTFKILVPKKIKYHEKSEYIIFTEVNNLVGLQQNLTSYNIRRKKVYEVKICCIVSIEAPGRRIIQKVNKPTKQR